MNKKFYLYTNNKKDYIVTIIQELADDMVEISFKKRVYPKKKQGRLPTNKTVNRDVLKRLYDADDFLSYFIL